MCDGTPCPCNLLTKHEGGRLPNHRKPSQSAQRLGVVVLTIMALAIVYGTCFMIYYW